MHTINYDQFELLRTDPRKYWAKDTVKSQSKLDILTQVVKVMFKNPKMVEHYFVIPPDVSNEDPKGILMQEHCSSMVLDFLEGNGGEIPPEVYSTILGRSLELADLPGDYKPTDALVKYGEYLLIKDERTAITKDIEREAARYVKQVTAVLEVDGEETESNDYGMADNPVRHPVLGREVWLNPNHKVAIDVKNLHREKVETIQLSGYADYISYVPDQKTAYITNIYICDNIIDFPRIYKEQNLERFLAFQKLVFQKIFKKFKFDYLVLDRTRRYVFEANPKIELIPEIEKALFTVSRGSHMPFEYDKKLIEL